LRGLSAWLSLVALVVLPGCSSSMSTYRAARDHKTPLQNAGAARECNIEGLKAIEKGDLAEAEEYFRKSLEHDLTYAPAHNNLGLVLLQTDRYYEAAWEFEYAAKLAPASPEPRDNLGLLFEELGKVDQAIGEYEKALDLDPQNLATMQHLARAYVKADRKDQRLKEVLERILLVPDDKQWDAWARGQLVRLGRVEAKGATAVIPDQPHSP
jgi:Tfp pilus assembly protein PilF